MNKKVLIVEDQFVEANDLQLMLRKAGYEVCGIARSVEIAREIIKKERPGLVLLDIFLKGKLTGIDLARELKKDNTAFIYLSANSNEEVLSLAKTTEPYGFIVKPFREKDLLVTLEIAGYRHEHSRETRYRREAEVIQQLERTISEKIGRIDKLLQAGKILLQEIPFDYLALHIDHPENTEDCITSFLRTGFNEYQLVGLHQLSIISAVSPDALIKAAAISAKQPLATLFNGEEFEKLTGQSTLKVLHEKFQMKSLLSFPMSTGSKAFSLCFYSRRTDTYTPDHIEFLHRLQPTLLKIIEQGPVTEKNNTKTSLSADDSSINMLPVFNDIIGKSHLLLNVFDLITQVAPFDTAVLILGESGTGKEKIAECIHQLSTRKNKPLVKVNCATLPATLIESELFGHEKGSFTGAIDKRTGKFEQANGGTIFLDEIGEMPVDLQVKLLRVLQEKEIDPIGSRSSVKIDVRIIAATNRNLEKEVGEGRFRLDLYYRLNVFPISLPPLRERKEDIPALASHFIQIYNRKSGKRVEGLSENVLNSMMAYNWPGNIRELENLIERGVLLSKGPNIEEVLLPNLSPGIIQHQYSQTKTINENEREYIISVLKKCHGKIWGADGAAELMKVPPTTLKSKMKKLGIQKEDTE